MKKQILLVFFWGLIIFLVRPESYRVVKRYERGEDLVFSSIYEQKQEIAKLCLVNPDPFYLYSVDSDTDLFPRIEDSLEILAERKQRGEPTILILADFSEQEKHGHSFNFKYLFRYLVLTAFSPPYLRQVQILNPNKTSEMFFIETKLKGKAQYGVIKFNELKGIGEAKKLIKDIDHFEEVSLVIAILNDYPIKLMIREEQGEVVLYESHPGHQEFTALFVASE
ncbi:MAG: hypothetical protein ACOX0C_03475 [Patescibacteria group bacterium]